MIESELLQAAAALYGDAFIYAHYDARRGDRSLLEQYPVFFQYSPNQPTFPNEAVYIEHRLSVMLNRISEQHSLYGQLRIDGKSLEAFSIASQVQRMLANLEPGQQLEVCEARELVNANVLFHLKEHLSKHPNRQLVLVFSDAGESERTLLMQQLKGEFPRAISIYVGAIFPAAVDLAAYIVTAGFDQKGTYFFSGCEKNAQLCRRYMERFHATTAITISSALSAQETQEMLISLLFKCLSDDDFFDNKGHDHRVRVQHAILSALPDGESLSALAQIKLSAQRIKNDMPGINRLIVFDIDGTLLKYDHHADREYFNLATYPALKQYIESCRALGVGVLLMTARPELLGRSPLVQELAGLPFCAQVFLGAACSKAHGIKLLQDELSAQHQLSLPSQAICLVDDTPEEIHEAQRTGIHSIQVGVQDENRINQSGTVVSEFAQSPIGQRIADLLKLSFTSKPVDTSMVISLGSLPRGTHMFGGRFTVNVVADREGTPRGKKRGADELTSTGKPPTGLPARV